MKENPVESGVVVPVITHDEMIGALTCKYLEGSGNDTRYQGHTKAEFCQVIPMEKDTPGIQANTP